MRTTLFAIAAATLAGPALAATYGPELEGFAYPHPVKHFSFS